MRLPITLVVVIEILLQWFSYVIARHKQKTIRFGWEWRLIAVSVKLLFPQISEVAEAFCHFCFSPYNLIGHACTNLVPSIACLSSSNSSSSRDQQDSCLLDSFCSFNRLVNFRSDTYLQQQLVVLLIPSISFIFFGFRQWFHQFVFIWTQTTRIWLESLSIIFIFVT